MATLGIGVDPAYGETGIVGLAAVLVDPEPVWAFVVEVRAAEVQLYGHSMHVMNVAQAFHDFPRNPRHVSAVVEIPYPGGRIVEAIRLAIDAGQWLHAMRNARNGWPVAVHALESAEWRTVLAAPGRTRAKLKAAAIARSRRFIAECWGPVDIRTIGDAGHGHEALCMALKACELVAVQGAVADGLTAYEAAEGVHTTERA